ncbi:unnamed protein product, partial [Musa textilis]
MRRRPGIPGAAALNLVVEGLGDVAASGCRLIRPEMVGRRWRCMRGIFMLTCLLSWMISGYPLPLPPPKTRYVPRSSRRGSRHAWLVPSTVSFALRRLASCLVALLLLRRWRRNGMMRRGAACMIGRVPEPVNLGRNGLVPELVNSGTNGLVSE